MPANLPRANGNCSMFDLDWLMLTAINYRSDFGPSGAPLFDAEDPKIMRMYNHPPFRRAYFRTISESRSTVHW